jgi:hypothetical protein
MKSWLLPILAFAWVMAPTAYANSSYTWDFDPASNTNLGTNILAYGNGGIGIAATASTSLYYKVARGDVGLGLACCNSDHEIEPGQAIVFNLSNLFSRKVTAITLTLVSIETGEAGQVCDFHACMTFGASDNGKSVNILALYSDMQAHHSGLLTVTSLRGDVLVNQLQATASVVPEPSSLMLMGSGLLAMIGFVRRKSRI